MADFVKAYKGDPQEGHLSTPISDSPLVKGFIGSLPAYRSGLSPLVRGLEVGLAHGYFLVGPWYKLGPLRDSEYAALGGLVSAVALVLIATVALSAHGIVSFQGTADAHDSLAAYSSANRIKSSTDWSQFAAGFFLGGSGGAFVAYFLLNNFSGIDAIFRGLAN